MQRLNCVIVDDEPIAREILAGYCEHLPDLQVVAVCSQALEAKRVLQQQPVHLLFLDIQMPLLDGLSLVKTLKAPPQIIFTTAYRDYALEAFELAACDYLQKPFSFERFMRAVDKASERLATLAPKAAPVDSGPEDFTFIRQEHKLYKVFYRDVLYAEAHGNHTRLVTRQATLLPLMTFTACQQLLSNPLFMRVHRSFIINRAQISHLDGNRIIIGSHEIPLGLQYRAAFFEAIGFKK
jgi:DNA-binding LytR/AlgR family response regulator